MMVSLPKAANVIEGLSSASAGAQPDPTLAHLSVSARPAIAARSGRGVLEGALMIPIRPHGRLSGILEIGRRAPFRSAEIASLEALVEALVDKLEGWAR